jgi:hypothetical protein
MRLRHLLLAAVSFGFVAAPAIAATKAHPHRKPAPKHHAVSGHAGIAVTMDEVRVITFTRPINTVFVGNPSIADATVIDSYHAFVLGKSYGITNLVALGPQSQAVANQQISVMNRSGGQVTLNKGAAQFSYTCTRAHCDASPLPGDQAQYFNEVNGSVSSHQDQAVKAANVAAAQH